ncbi:hypothetical protein N7522_004561 [Penicillium canescens]|nr:hypothetical protein N7522_004561 [Penicillium canescens]
MLDPFPPPPIWLRQLVEPGVLFLNLPALSNHIHEILISFAGYQIIQFFLGPWMSRRLFPQYYLQLDKRTKLNWDVHVVSLVQSIVVSSLALWIIFADKERKTMNTSERIYGYSGGCAMLGALAIGYFLYDLIISAVHIEIYGVGMLFHAITASCVFSFGFVSRLASPIDQSPISHENLS